MMKKLITLLLSLFFLASCNKDSNELENLRNVFSGISINNYATDSYFADIEKVNGLMHSISINRLTDTLLSLTLQDNKLFSGRRNYTDSRMIYSFEYAENETIIYEDFYLYDKLFSTNEYFLALDENNRVTHIDHFYRKEQEYISKGTAFLTWQNDNIIEIRLPLETINIEYDDKPNPIMIDPLVPVKNNIVSYSMNGMKFVKLDLIYEYDENAAPLKADYYYEGKQEGSVTYKYDK